MNRIILPLLAAITLLSGCHSEKKQTLSNSWTIEGTVANAAPTDTLIITGYPSDIKDTKATLLVKDGVITPVRGSFDKTEICCIRSNRLQRMVLGFVLERGTIHLDMDMNYSYMKHVGGTPVNDDLDRFFDGWNRYSEENPDASELYGVVSDIVRKYPDHVVSPFLIERCRWRFTPTQMLSLIDLLSPEQQKTPDIDRMKDWLLVAQETEVGKPFKELKGTDLAGKPAALSEYVAKGSYVLADFWGPRCGACLMEMPRFIELGRKYEAKGLKVVGIARETAKRSEAKVREKGMTFPLIFEAKFMSTYGIIAIPHVILFGPDGTVIARGRLDTVEKKLREIFPD